MRRREVVRAAFAALVLASLVPLAGHPSSAWAHASAGPADSSPGAGAPTDLATVKGRLDELASRDDAPPEVTAWWADPASGSVVVALDRVPRVARAAAWLDAARRVDPRVRVVPGLAAMTPRDGPLHVVGGDGITLDDIRCSVGFGARTATGAVRVITAGHCTRSGGDVREMTDALLGPVRSTVFDRDGDWGVVDAGAGWTTADEVAGLAGGTQHLTGTATAAVGAAVCRTGSTTGWHCGNVVAVDVTANYPSGPVLGLTLTTACSEPGDSGGPFVADGAALGVLSGGSGDCATAGGSTLYQPIDEVLVREHLRL